MRIEVSENDILCGVKGDPVHCPIARALERQTGYEAVVDPDEISLKIAGHMHCMDIPPLCEEFVKFFDTGYPVAPFSFELPDFLIDPAWHTLLLALDNVGKHVPEADLVAVP